MNKINLKQGLNISKSKITTLQDEHLQQVKGGRGVQMARASTKGANCSCTSHSCNTNVKTAQSSFQTKLSVRIRRSACRLVYGDLICFQRVPNRIVIKTADKSFTTKHLFC